MVFYGLYTPLQGTPVIGAALGALAGAPVEVTMIGGGQDEARPRPRPRPTRRSAGWTGCPPPNCPRWWPSHDVCLGIFGTGAKALRVVPNKVFQGVAAGCAIVTSDTAAAAPAAGRRGRAGAAG